jgi:hypothetical protein
MMARLRTGRVRLMLGFHAGQEIFLFLKAPRPSLGYPASCSIGGGA